jgi:hypothetical protein
MNTDEIVSANDFVETKTLRYKLGSIWYYAKLFTIQVRVLHYLASVEITIETIEINFDSKPFIRYDRHLIGEKLTLKYFL